MQSRLWILCCLVAFCLPLGGCEDTSEFSQEQSFLATVLEYSDTSVLVEPLEGEAIRDSSDRLRFGAEGIEAIGAVPGDTVRIVYTGLVLESYPAVINVASWSLEEKVDATPIVDRTLLGTTPPPLSVRYGDAHQEIASGSSIWTFLDPEQRRMVSIATDSLHPLDSRSHLPRFAKSKETTLLISFPVPPDSIEVRCWPEAYLERSSDFHSQYEALVLNEGQVTLPSIENGLVLEVSATWENEGSTTSYGDASYAFFISSTN